MSDNDPFKILGDQSVPEKNGMPVFEEDQSGELKERIERLINTSEVFLFCVASAKSLLIFSPFVSGTFGSTLLIAPVP